MSFRLIFVTLQVAKREKLAKIQEEEAVQRAMESELNKTIYITGKSLRAFCQSSMDAHHGSLLDSHF